MGHNSFYKKGKVKLLAGLVTLFLGLIEDLTILILENGIPINMIEGMISRW